MLHPSLQPGSRLFVFGDDWGGHPSSTQHLFRCFLDSHAVTWFNTVSRWPRLTLRDARKIFSKLREASRTESVNPSVRDVLVLPLSGGAIARSFNAWQLRRAVRAGDPAYLISTLPLTADLFEAVPRFVRVYYVVDDYAAWPGLGALTSQLDRLQAEHSDLIVCASQSLAERYRSWTRASVKHLPHGVDLSHFAKARAARHAPDFDVLFFGALDERFDQDLFAEILDRRPNWRYVVMGPRTVPLSPRVERACVRFVPPVAFDDLPHELARSRVALLPYVSTALGQGLSPLKVREALVAGLPVVTTPVPELPDLPGIFTGSTPDELVARLEQALASPECVPALSAFANDSWQQRANQLSSWLFEAHGQKHAT